MNRPPARLLSRPLTRLIPRLIAATITSLLPFLHTPSHAQTSYPAKTITLVVPVAAGGAADALGRAWSDYIGKALGKTVVVDNRAGANGSLAALQVARQPPDGYTLLLGGTSSLSLNPLSYKKLAYDPGRDFDVVTMLAVTSQVLVANASLGVKSIDDLVRLARAKPGQMNFGSAGKGNSTHLNTEFVLDHYNLTMTHVPFKGAAPALQALLANDVQLTSDAIASVLPQVATGRIVPLLIFADKRDPALPQVPTVTEAGIKDYPGGGWYGLAVPKGTPRAVVELLNEHTQRFWADKDVQVRMKALHMSPPPAWGSAAVQRVMQSETRVWGPLIKRLDIQND